MAFLFAEQLGQRLETESGGIHKQKAQLCYAIAGDLHKLVDNWMSAIQPTTPEQMQVLPQLTCIFYTVHFSTTFLPVNNVVIPAGSCGNGCHSTHCHGA